MRTSVAVIAVAVTALLASSAGATAGTLITGKQIKDGTVTSADIKDGTIRLVDMNASSNRRVFLPRNVPSTRAKSSVRLPKEQTTLVSSVTVPAGSYVLSAVATITPNMYYTTGAWCWWEGGTSLTKSNTQQGWTRETNATGGGDVIALLATATFSASTVVNLKCVSGGSDASLSNVEFLAEQVSFSSSS